MHTLEKLIALPSNHNHYSSDFEKRFQYGFLLRSYNGEVVPIYIGDRYDTNLYNVYVWGIKKDGLDIKNTKWLFDIWLPDPGYYLRGNTIIQLSQAPMRQWCRTFSTKTYKFRRAMLNSLSGENINDVVKCIFEPTKFTKLDDVKNSLAYVITRKICVSPQTDELSLLFYRGVSIGELNFTTRKIRLLYPLLEQEVRDLFRNQEVKQWTFQ